jgi:hypothetical protein
MDDLAAVVNSFDAFLTRSYNHLQREGPP